MLHREKEVKWIETQEFFRKNRPDLTPEELEFIDIWNQIMVEREMTVARDEKGITIGRPKPSHQDG